MSRTALTAWYDEVLPNVPGCGQPMARHAIRNAAIDFCTRTFAWRVDHDPLAAQANEPEYPFEPPSKTRVVKVMAAWFDGKEIFPKSPDQLNRLYANWRTQTGTPLYFTQRLPDVLRLVPYPNTSLQNAIAFEVALRPSGDATDIESSIFDEFSEDIKHGVLARLFAMKSKPWSDAERAKFHLDAFDQAIGVAKVRADKGYTRSRKRVRAHFF